VGVPVHARDVLIGLGDRAREHGIVLSYGRDRSDEALGVMVDKLNRFAVHRRPSDLDFDQAEREKAGDVWHRPDPAAKAAGGPKRPKKGGRASSAGDIRLT
jgi:hypothetical protein